MHKLVIALACAACGGGAALKPEPTSRAWPQPTGFHSETIRFPLEFAPGLAHTGVEELRFAPGFFDPATPGYWSYAFAWRTTDPAELDAAAIASELTTYFRGLAHAVDDKLATVDAIAATGTPDGTRVALRVHMIDAFKTKQPVELAGWAARRACGTGALWVFVLAPEHATLRPQLDALAAQAACEQPVLQR